MQRVAMPTRRTLGSELRAIGAIARKEWRIFLRYPSWVLALLIWPILFPFGYIFTAKALGGPSGEALPEFARLTGTSDVVGFIVLGSLLWMWINMTLWDVGMYLRGEQMRGTLESNWLCPTWRISLLLGGALTKLGVALVFMAVSLLEFRFLFGVRLFDGNMGLALLAMLLTIPIVEGIGVGFASLVLRFKEANAMVFMVRGIFMIFCGITFPVAVLPGWMQAVATALPLTYSIRAIRSALLAHASFAELQGDLAILALFALILPLLGYAAFRRVERGTRQRGDLGQY